MDRVVETITPKKLPTMQIKRVCAYARVSYDKDTMIHSLSAQISYYQDYIQSHPGVAVLRCLCGRADFGNEGDEKAVLRHGGRMQKGEH
jgi:site-specific DNA recombinase